MLKVSLKSIILLILLLISCKDKTDKKQDNLALDETRANIVKVKIDWNYINFPDHVKIYELKSQMPYQLWDTHSVRSIDVSPASTEIPESNLTIQTGRFKEFVLGIQNTSNTPLYFFAAPHSVQPPEYSLGFKFKCLCINHAFSIKPGEFWYRVVKLNIDKDFRGKEFSIKHDIIGISEERMKDFALDKEKSLHDHQDSENIDR